MWAHQGEESFTAALFSGFGIEFQFADFLAPPDSFPEMLSAQFGFVLHQLSFDLDKCVPYGDVDVVPFFLSRDRFSRNCQGNGSVIKRSGWAFFDQNPQQDGIRRESLRFPFECRDLALDKLADPWFRSEILERHVEPHRASPVKVLSQCHLLTIRTEHGPSFITRSAIMRSAVLFMTPYRSQVLPPASS